MAKSKPKKTEVDIAIAHPPSDRYKSNYLTWKQFVLANFPEDKYPAMRQEYLK